jgi:outer membrane receptor for ferrienterochelin and colicins
VVILGGGYTWNKLEIGAQARWQSRFTDYRYTAAGLVPVYVADYLTTRLRVGYNLTDHLTLALTGQQLNVPRVLQAAGPPVERSIIASATVHF